MSATAHHPEQSGVQLEENFQLSVQRVIREGGMALARFLGTLAPDNLKKLNELLTDDTFLAFSVRYLHEGPELRIAIASLDGRHQVLHTATVSAETIAAGMPTMQ